MIARSEIQFIALVLLFSFCQVIGFMCAVPDVSLVSDNSVSSEHAMTCPMDGTTACQPSVASSPERQITHCLVTDVDYVTILSSPVGVLKVPSTHWSWSNEYSIVPASIGFSSVLRI